MHTTLKSLALLAFTATVVSAQSAAPASDAVVVDAKLPDYAVTSGVSGNLNAVGSDTLINLMTFWGEGLRPATRTSTLRSKARVPAPLRSP